MAVQQGKSRPSIEPPAGLALLKICLSLEARFCPNSNLREVGYAPFCLHRL
jgi:hypothetical protein